MRISRIIYYTAYVVVLTFLLLPSLLGLLPSQLSHPLAKFTNSFLNFATPGKTLGVVFMSGGLIACTTAIEGIKNRYIRGVSGGAEILYSIIIFLAGVTFLVIGIIDWRK